LYEVADWSDDAVVKRCKDEHVDIAIDLSGFTAGCRPEIFSKRPAPVVINFLGFPASMGSGFHDYIVTDWIVAPAGSERLYAERLIRLGVPYQPNDPSRKLSAVNPQEAIFNGPRFRFGCFNNQYKITPECFSAWMDILRACPDSDLYLLFSSNEAARNLRSKAESNNVNPSRLIFLPRVPLDVHLGRTSNLDIFLDTYPYNAHTTASDALWAGVPIVTYQGSSFASRVASSFLVHCDLAGCVANSWADYIKIAVWLYSDRAALADLKHKVGVMNSSLPLFNIGAYVSQFECALFAVYLRAQHGAPKRNIHIQT
jgi:predicted O-linked N-acetylglucosamine transferase (SPINDLY family)